MGVGKMGVGELAPNRFSSMHLHVCRLGYTGMYKPVMSM